MITGQEEVLQWKMKFKIVEILGFKTNWIYTSNVDRMSRFRLPKIINYIAKGS